MANTKISALTEATAPLGGDLFPIVQTPTGTPVTKYVKGYHLIEMSDRIYKFVVTIAAGSLTLALKDMSGNDFSSANPLNIRIGNTWRQVTGSLSVAIPAAANYFNAGSAELATKEIDLFVYIAWRTTATAQVSIGLSRIPSGSIYTDFSALGTNEKYGLFNPAISGTDEVTVIGRIAATLSAGAGYTWTSTSQSAPTTINTIQRPIYETRLLTYAPQWTASGTAPAIGNGVTGGKYQIRGSDMLVNFIVTFGTTSTYGTGSWMWSMPFAASSITPSVWFGPARNFDSSASTFYFGGCAISASGQNLLSIGTHGALFTTATVPFTWATGDIMIFQIEVGI